MDIDWSKFTVCANYKGEVEWEHEEEGCRKTIYLTSSYFTIAEMMRLTEEHLETCPVWTGE